MKSIYKQFTPYSTTSIPASAQVHYTQPSIYERSSLGMAPYTRPMFGLDIYSPEVQRLCMDMARFFEVLRDSLLVCLEVMRQEEYIRRNAQHCKELYHDFKDENYLRIRKHIHSIKLNTSEFDPYNNPAIDLRQSCSTEEEFAQRGFHALEWEDACTLSVKELVEEEQRGIFSVEELLLFNQDSQKIITIRYIISHFDDFLPHNPKRKKVPATYVACLMAWCDIPLQRNRAFVNYFADTYEQNGQYKAPSNSAVNQAKRSEWKSIPEFEQLISQWESIDLS